MTEETLILFERDRNPEWDMKIDTSYVYISVRFFRSHKLGSYIKLVAVDGKPCIAFSEKPGNDTIELYKDYRTKNAPDGKKHLTGIRIPLLKNKLIIERFLAKYGVTVFGSGNEIVYVVRLRLTSRGNDVYEISNIAE